MGVETHVVPQITLLYKFIALVRQEVVVKLTFTIDSAMVELQLTKSFRIRTDQPDITSNFTGTTKLTKDSSPT